MSRYRITATVTYRHRGFLCSVEVPTFSLDGNIHGLATPKQAEIFAHRMIAGLPLRPAEQITVAAVEEDPILNLPEQHWSRSPSGR